MAVAARRLPLLDSLRALTTLAILLAHTFGPSGAHTSATLRPFTTRFEFTIAVFMMLTAFLVYRPFARAHIEGKPGPDTKLYAWNRFVRVAPPYWVALTITALWVTTAGIGVFTARGFPTYYGFGQVYFSDTLLGGIPIAWFLCILVAFYLVVPAYARLMRRFGGADRTGRLRAQLWGCAAVFAIGVVYRLVIDLAGLRSEPALTHLLPAYFDWLAPGMALGALSVWYGRRWSAPTTGEGAEAPLPGVLGVVQRRPSVGLLLALFAFWVVSTRIGLSGPYPDPGDHLQYLSEHMLNLVIALCVFAPLAVGNPGEGATRRVLSHPALLWLSAISYGILLYHLAVIEQLKDWGFSPTPPALAYVAWPVVTLALVIPLGWCSHRLIERPLQGLDPFGRGRGPRIRRTPPSEPPRTAATSAAE